MNDYTEKVRILANEKAFRCRARPKFGENARLPAAPRDFQVTYCYRLPDSGLRIASDHNAMDMKKTNQMHVPGRELHA